MPGIVGVLLAAPLVLELEQRTHRLAWTQSISRARWLAGKLGFAVAVALAASLVFTLLVTWWRAPIVRIERSDGSERLRLRGHRCVRLHTLRTRALPPPSASCGGGRLALVVGFVGYFAVRVFVDTWLRQRFLSPVTATFHLLGNGPDKLRHAWVFNQYPSDRAGHHIQIPFGLCGPPPPGGGKPDIGNCLANHGVFMHATYLPASRFWALQGIETALFGGVAVVLLAFAAWWTYRRAD